MSIPAVIFRDSSSDALPVAGLSVLDRLVVSLHRAGCSPITIVGSGPLLHLKRSLALGVEIDLRGEAPRHEGKVVVVSSNVLVSRQDIELLISREARLMNARGEELPAGVSTVMAISSAESSREALQEAPTVVASGLAAVVDGPEAARQTELSFWASLDNPADGLVDRYINRPLALPFIRYLVQTPIRPNQVTFISLVIGLLGAWSFARGGHASAIWGAVLFQFAAVIDCIDGSIARALFKESRVGEWFDITADQVVHVALFLGIAVGVGRADGSAVPLALGVIAATGVLISFAVVLRGKRQLSDAASARGSTLRKLTDAGTNRDFSVLLFACAIVDRVGLFLWATAVGIHIFWVVALLAQHAGAGWRRGRLPADRKLEANS